MSDGTNNLIVYAGNLSVEVPNPIVDVQNRIVYAGNLSVEVPNLAGEVEGPQI